jgi:DNA polymerase-3 subunit epsilon/CBS domain-containing protein
MALASDSKVLGTTALLALDAVAIDTETTGLDPRKARVVEFGAVRIAGGRVDPSAALRVLVNPGEPIPDTASRVHGIRDGDVAGAPAFAAAWPQISAAIGDTVLIAHTIGFDLAVFARECGRAGVTWEPPPVLDTRLLAEIAEPALADYSPDSLAAWLGVTITGRHSALGDARAAAEIFRALVPKLRQKGVRTLAEALRASRSLTATLAQQQQAGWSDVAPPQDDTLPNARIDSYPYRHRTGELMAAAQFIAPEATIGAALDAMMRARISSLFVAAPGQARPQDTGIITERDILRAIARDRTAALALPVTQAMSRPLETVPADAFAYLAVSRMNRLKVRHLGVTDDAGIVVGALSARDLLRLRAEGGILLGDRIDQAADAGDLAGAWGHLAEVAAGLLREGLAAREVATVVSRELCAMTQRAAIIAERRMDEAGAGTPPCPYAFVVLGSAARGESLLAMDQDNAIVFAEGRPDSAEDRWFAQLGTHVADILHEAGVPYCTGGIMAKNAAWRGSVATWQSRVRDWIGRSNPQDLLSVDILFDQRGVHGDAALASSLWRESFDLAAGEAGFAKLLAETAGTVAPALNWIGGFKTENGRIDLKKSGLFGIVSMARALAIRHHVTERATAARLSGIKALGLGAEADLDALIDAQATFLDLILGQQIRDIANGVPPGNAVEVKQLTRRDRERLHAALRAVTHLDTLTRELLFRG